MKNLTPSEPNRVRPVKVTGLKLGNAMNETVGSPVSIAESEVHESAFVSTPLVKRVHVNNDKVGSPPASSKPISFKKLLKSLTPKRMRSWMKKPAEDDNKKEEQDVSDLPGLPVPSENVPNDSEVVVFERAVSSSRTRSNASSRSGSRDSSVIPSVFDFTQPEDGISFQQIRTTEDTTLCALSCDDSKQIRSDTATPQESKSALRDSGKTPQSLISIAKSDIAAVGSTNAETLKKVQGPPCVPILSFDDFLAGNFGSEQSHHEPQTEDEKEPEEAAKLGSLQELSEEFIRFGSDEDDEEESETRSAQSNSGQSSSDELTRLGSLEIALGEGICRRLLDIKWDDDIDGWELDDDDDDGEDESLVF